MAKEARDTIEYKQATLPPPKPPELNIVPTKTGSVMKEGELSSPNFREGRSGWRVEADGSAEFRNITASGTFTIGGTTITVKSVSEISDALNTIENAGGGTLYLDNGTYVLTADINVPSGVMISGVSRDSVIIDCNSSYAIKLNGTNTYTTGTVSITNGTTTVTGVGTTWTSAMIGRYIFLDGFWYKITNRSSNTQITIGSAFTGNDLSGASYAIATPNSTATLRRLTIHNATGSGIISQYSSEPKFDDLLVYGCGTGMEFDYCYAPYIFSSVYENGTNLDFNYTYSFRVDFSAFDDSTTGNGVTMANSGDATFFDSAVSGNTGDGINLTSCRNIVFLSIDLSTNGGQGVELVSGNTDIQFIGVTAIGNTSDGYKLTATSDRITIANCSIKDNGGYGINISASTCDDNYIVAPVFSGNTSGEVSDSGTNTVRIQQTDSPRLAGDGSDGDVTISAPTTITRDMYYNNLTVNSTLTTDGYKIFVKGTLSGSGTIKWGTPNAGTAGSTGTSNGVGGAQGGTGPLKNVAGGDGGDGQTAGSSGNGVAGTAGASSNPCIGSNGSAGGTGGSAGARSGGTGGAGGTKTAPNTSFGIYSWLTASFIDLKTDFTLAQLIGQCGSGGGGGGGDDSATGTSGAGGGGGASGGIVLIFANIWAGTFTIDVAGANGGNGGASSGFDVGGGGGGGGGNGGIAVVVYVTKTWTGSYTLTAGTKGTGGATSGLGTGTAGSDGTNGTAGTSFEISALDLV